VFLQFVDASGWMTEKTTDLPTIYAFFKCFLAELVKKENQGKLADLGR